MAKISALSALGAAPATDDQFVILDVSDTSQGAGGSTKKLAASRVARTGEDNAYTGVQTMTASSTSATPLDVRALSGASANVQTWRYDGTLAARMVLFPTIRAFVIDAHDNGTGSGARLQAGRNNNGSTSAAGHAALEDAGGLLYYVWPDDTGVLRISTTAPTSATDTGGTVVGAQTSWHELKEAIAEWDGAEALDAIKALTLYSYQMIEDGHKTPDGDKPTYYGLVITDDDRANNAWFGLGYANNQTPSLNDRNLFGYLIAAVKEQAAQIEALTARVEALEAV